MASLISGSTGSLTSSGSSSGTNEDCVINEGHFSSSCSSLELEDIQEAIEGVRRTILETEERSDARKELVHRLIRLRIKREDWNIGASSFILVSLRNAATALCLLSQVSLLPGLHIARSVVEQLGLCFKLFTPAAPVVTPSMGPV